MSYAMYMTHRRLINLVRMLLPSQKLSNAICDLHAASVCNIFSGHEVVQVYVQKKDARVGWMLRVLIKKKQTLGG